MIEKELKDISWNVTEKEYRADLAISYSMLSTYAKRGFRGVKEVLEGDKISTGSLRHGSAVDTLLTAPEEFKDLYIIADYSRPSDIVRNIVDSLWQKSLQDKTENMLLEKYAVEYPEAMLQVINSHNYGGDNWKPETKINKIVEGGAEYYNLLVLTKGEKTLIHQDDYNLALGCVQEIKSNPYTSWLFDLEDNCKVYFQLKFKINFANDGSMFNIYSNPLEWQNSIEEKDTIRCMFDIIYVDYNNKVITPIDLKTTSKYEESFKEAFADWHYDLQSTTYSYILRQVCANDDYFKDFRILPFRFLPVNKFTLSPQWFIHEDSVKDIQSTFKDYNNVEHRPWYVLLDKVRWHIKKDNFRYNMDTVINNGCNYISTHGN